MGVKAAVLATVFFFIPACSTLADDDELLDSREMSVPADALKKIRFEVEAGFLEISGEPATDKVRIMAAFRGRPSPSADATEILRDLQLSHSILGDTLVVTTRTRDSYNGRIDLTINIPDRLNISIDDTSGSIQVERIQGHLDIQDQWGEVEVKEIQGAVTLDDESGSISIRNVRNNVTIEDSSGDISVTGIQGSVTIGDSSGSINVKDVEGDFVVRRDNSGSVDYSAIKGRIRLAGRK